MSDIRDILRGKGVKQAPEAGGGNGEAGKIWTAEHAPEPKPAPPPPEKPDSSAVPSGRTHNRPVSTLFVYPPGEALGLMFQYCDMTSPGQVAVDGTAMLLFFRGVGGMWRVAIEGERLDHLAGCVGEHKQSRICVTMPGEWSHQTKLVEQAIIENIVVTPPKQGEDEEAGEAPNWPDSPT